MIYGFMFIVLFGAGLISLEVGADVQNTQSKIALARGASRRFGVPWSVDVSPWLGNSCTSHGREYRHLIQPNFTHSL